MKVLLFLKGIFVEAKDNDNEMSKISRRVPLPKSILRVKFHNLRSDQFQKSQKKC